MQETNFSYIRSISTFFYILLGGQVLLACIMFGIMYFGQTDPYSWEYYSGNLALLGLAISIICRYAADYLYKKKLNVIVESNKPIQKKLEEYMSANIQRWAIMEFGILFLIILVYITRNQLLMFLTGFMFFLFIVMRPTSAKIIDDLNIDVDKIQN